MEQNRFLLIVTIHFLLQYHYLVGCSPAPTFTNIDTDTSALLALKTRINSDPNAVLAANWTTDAPVCAWTGIICSTRHKRVASLAIPDMGIVGTLPPDLGNLSFLVMLNIGNNSFHGDLPPEIAHLHRLRILDLQFNAFSGPVPSWFGSLRSLRFLSLWNNSFTGSIPPSLSNASKLEELDLGYNHLEGAIPSEMGNLKNLRSLFLDANQLSGSLPHGIFNPSLEELVLLSNGLSGDLPQNMCDHSPKLRDLDLSSNNFIGTIPSGIYKCKMMETLVLFENAYSGSISNEIGNLTMLKVLYIGHNNLTGEIPELNSLVNLERLSMPRNFLKGPLPRSIFNISSLLVLEVTENRLSGSLPWDMCHRLPLIQFFGFGENEFTGSFPSSIGNCTFLQIISAAVANFTGELPSNIGNMRDIEGLFFSRNYLSGFIPESIFNATKLIKLDLGVNLFSGFIPNNLQHLGNIEVFYLSDNNLTTQSNIFLTLLTKSLHLRVLGLSGNPLQITLPDSIGNFRNLETLELEDTKIVGTIPTEVGYLSKLIHLNLQDNELVGTVPKTIGQLRNLQILNLRGNKLEGHLPASVCSSIGLGYLLLSRNQFSGSLPKCLGEVTSLRHILMSSNRFTSIPPSFWMLKDLLILNLSSNLLTGELPKEIGNLKVVNEIDLSNNQLSGQIPSTFGSLKNLKNLSLAENTLVGSIPPSIGSSTSLESLNLSHNKLSGTIPKSFEKLRLLRELDVSFNELEGEIPQGGPFSNFTAQSYLPNHNLCGSPKFHVRPCSSTRLHQPAKRMVNVLKYILPAIASLVIIALVLFLAWMRWRKRNIKVTDQENSLSPIVPKGFSYLELTRATNGFSESNLLGKGTFSSVYKGKLHDETMIAVKIFDLQVEGSLRSFDTECEVLRNVRHRNLVKVIGSCANLDYKALVTDYMPNGSLEKWLHEPEHERLNILQRMNIAIDVASALEYLHHGYSTVIVHCDVKPSNVLLDEDMVAHLGDYGITKLLGEEQCSDRTKTLATIGYISPEYGSEGIVSAQGDVYSFGITLLEMFTRKRPTDDMFVGEMSLKRWVMETLLIDKDVLSGEDERSRHEEKCIKTVMQLAVSCCEESPEERIDIKQVANELKKIKVAFLESIPS